MTDSKPRSSCTYGGNPSLRASRARLVAFRLESIEGSATPRQVSARMKSRFGCLCRCARSSGAVVVANNVRRVIVRLRAAAAIIAQPVVKDWGRDGKRRRQRNSDKNRGKITWTVGLSSAGTIISRDPRRNSTLVAQRLPIPPGERRLGNRQTALRAHNLI